MLKARTGLLFRSSSYSPPSQTRFRHQTGVGSRNKQNEDPDRADDPDPRITRLARATRWAEEKQGDQHQRLG